MIDNHALMNFIRESNKIEGIRRPPTAAEIVATKEFLKQPSLTIRAVSDLVSVYQPDAIFRNKPGLNVRVGEHYPPPGGAGIKKALQDLLDKINKEEISPYYTHHLYETLHPFTDGNGRSGRAVWLWQMYKKGLVTYISLGFLHAFYYQTLQNGPSR